MESINSTDNYGYDDDWNEIPKNDSTDFREFGKDDHSSPGRTYHITHGVMVVAGFFSLLSMIGNPIAGAVAIGWVCFVGTNPTLVKSAHVRNFFSAPFLGSVALVIGAIALGTGPFAPAVLAIAGATTAAYIGIYGSYYLRKLVLATYRNSQVDRNNKKRQPIEEKLSTELNKMVDEEKLGERSEKTKAYEEQQGIENDSEPTNKERDLQNLQPTDAGPEKGHGESNAQATAPLVPPPSPPSTPDDAKSSTNGGAGFKSDADNLIA